MASKTFAAQLEDIADLTIEALEYTMRQSISDVLTGAQETQDGITIGATSFVEGRIPVGKTKDLVNSLTVDGAEGADVSVKIQGMEIGDTMEFAWTVPYARRIEYGFTGTDSLGRTFDVPGRFFVTRNAEQFPDHVKKRANEVRR